MAAEHELPDRQDQRLDAQKQGVHKADGVNRMQGKPFESADVLRREQFVIARIGLGCPPRGSARSRASCPVRREGRWLRKIEKILT